MCVVFVACDFSSEKSVIKHITPLSSWAGFMAYTKPSGHCQSCIETGDQREITDFPPKFDQVQLDASYRLEENYTAIDE